MPRASSPPNCSPPRRSAGPGGTPRCRIWSFVPMRTGWKSGGLPRSRCIPLPSYDRLPSLLHYPEGILASCCSADVHDSTVVSVQYNGGTEDRVQCSRRVSTTWMAFGFGAYEKRKVHMPQNQKPVQPACLYHMDGIPRALPAAVQKLDNRSDPCRAMEA
jgi:hypothetical protein